MVEMLGVLAVMGVLSVGGIGGYTMAMRKHRANEIVSQLNLMGHECSRYYILSNGASPCDASELATAMDFATIGTNFAGVGDKMATTISDLDADLMTALKERLGEWGKTYVVGETAGTLSLQMNKDFSDWDSADKGATPCGEEGACENGVCNQGACEACPDGKVPEGNQCVCENIAGCLQQDMSTCKCTGGCEGEFMDDGNGGCELYCAAGTEANADGSACRICVPDEDCGCPEAYGTGSVSNGNMACMCGQGYEPKDDCQTESGFECACQKCTGANAAGCQYFEYNSCKCSVCKDGYTLDTSNGVCVLHCDPGHTMNSSGTACELCAPYQYDREQNSYIPGTDGNCGCQETYGFNSVPSFDDNNGGCEWICNGSNSYCPPNLYCSEYGAPYSIQCMPIGEYTELKENDVTVAVMSDTVFGAGISTENWCDRVTESWPWNGDGENSALGCSTATGKCSKVVDGTIRISGKAWAGFMDWYYTVDSNGNYEKLEWNDSSMYPVICKGTPKY